MKLYSFKLLLTKQQYLNEPNPFAYNIPYLSFSAISIISIQLTFPLLSLFISFIASLSVLFGGGVKGMNGKSILSAMGRHTPEHSAVMSTAGSGATTSPCSSRSSSQRSGTGAHTPGGPHRSPCTQVKTTESSSNALTPNAGPARSPVSPKLSPGETVHWDKMDCTWLGYSQRYFDRLLSLL